MKQPTIVPQALVSYLRIGIASLSQDIEGVAISRAPPSAAEQQEQLRQIRLMAEDIVALATACEAIIRNPQAV